MGVIVGLEGGGTKTGCAVLNEQGALLAYGQGGPANLNFVSEAQQRESFETAIESALKGISEPVLALGYTVAGTFANWEWVLKRLGNPQAFAVEETRMAFVSTGADVAHGLAIVAGTGSVISAFVSDRLARTVGGWGALIGDEGSAYDLARHGLQLAVRSWDGREPPSQLVNAVQAFFGISDLRELIPLLYQRGMPRHELARFATHVLETAESGDALAQQLVVERATVLARDALACARGVFEPQEPLWVALTGGMFRQPSLFQKTFEEVFSREFPRAHYHTPLMEPAVAVARIAWRRYRADSA
ncbi:BadF-type ATPase [Armatimonadetes bacterium GBS]|jgi:N-acetylglucosamine kinase|nr:MAG: ATPase [Fimbriimonadales bacterium]CUU03863.1 BadF-type ATPase [Armatimonadetes bacterium GBS]CUU33850.1 BadF-type ATPase [Armatimonadetes bacterium GXS]